jgi:hypothetical protein
MANTYTQIYIQVVFAVEARQNLIQSDRNEELQKYISGIVTRPRQKLLAIHGMPLVGDVKTGSSNHINEQKWVNGRFSWQEGFGALSYSHSQLSDVIGYIQNQEKHHAKKSFREEYLTMLEEFEVPHDERYIFKELK